MGKEFKIKNNVLRKYYEQEGKTEVVVPNGVVEIGEKAFMNCKEIKKITLPDSIKKIRNQAFYECINLEDINVPNSVTIIGSYAFAHCEKLENIYLSEQLKIIGSYAFWNCKNLKTITIPDSVTIMGTEPLDYRYTKNINIYSSRIFNILDEKFKFHALISSIKNYSSGKIKYRESDMTEFK